MNKIRKSETDIKKEIEKILSNNNIDTLINSINFYMNNLTGKELVNEFKVKQIILNVIEKNKPELLKNKKFINECNILNPVLNFYIYKNHKGFSNYDIIDLKSKLHIICIEQILAEMIYNDVKKWNKYKNSDIKKPLTNEKEYKNFYDYLKNNPVITELLYKCIYNETEIICKWIIEKKIPLSTIIYFFDNKKDIKENTENIYSLLNKKFPRNEIQKTLLRTLKKR